MAAMRFAMTLALVMGLLAGPARADTATVADDRDFSRRLDIVEASHGHTAPAGDGAMRLTHEITSAGSWARRSIRCRVTGCEGYFALRFDIDADGRYDRSLYLFSRRGQLRGEMFKHGPKHDCQLPRVACGDSRFLGRVSVRKPTGRSIAATFRLSMLRTGLSRYGWRSEVKIGPVTRCRGDISRSMHPAGMVCIDRAPRKRFVRHLL